MSVLALPMAPAGSVQEQVTQQYAYLVQMAQQLNLALGQLEALGGGAGEASARRQANGRLGTAASETADGQYETLRSMILKTADQVQKTTAALTAKLEEEYVASSDFGSYVAKLSAQLEAAPEAVTQYYSFFSDLQANVEKVDAAFAHYKLDTEGYIRTGIVYYDGAAPGVWRGCGTGPDVQRGGRREGGGAEQLSRGVHRHAAVLLAGCHGGGLCVQQPAVHHEHYGAGRYRCRAVEHGGGGGRTGLPVDRRVSV